MTRFDWGSGSGPDAVGKPALGPTNRKRVLVVDDDLAVRSFIAQALAARGDVDVETAGDGLEALAKLRAGRFDAVVSDIEMPGCSGLTVATAARQTRPGMRVVLMTGAGAAMGPAAAAAGASTFLEKPFDLAALVKAIGC